MRRRLARPFGKSAPPSRMLSLLMALAVIAMLYQRVKEPQFWRWMIDESRADNAADVSEEPNAKNAVADSTDKVAKDKSELKKGDPEDLDPGPNETDPDELAKLQSNFNAILDR